MGDEPASRLVIFSASGTSSPDVPQASFRDLAPSSASRLYRAAAAPPAPALHGDIVIPSTAYVSKGPAAAMIGGCGSRGPLLRLVL